MPLPSSPRSFSTATQSDSPPSRADVHSSDSDCNDPRSRAFGSISQPSAGSTSIHPPTQVKSSTFSWSHHKKDHETGEGTSVSSSGSEDNQRVCSCTSRTLYNLRSDTSAPTQVTPQPETDLAGKGGESESVTTQIGKAVTSYQSPRDLETGASSKQKSVTFLPRVYKKGGASLRFHVSNMAGRRDDDSPSASPLGHRRNKLEDGEEAQIGSSRRGRDESSADENTAILSERGKKGSGYGSVHKNVEPTESPLSPYEAETEDDPVSGATTNPGGPSSSTAKKKKNSILSTKTNITRKSSGSGSDSRADGQGDQAQDGDRDGWIKRFIDKYGSIELENKGSVARDHLALERTYLAWLRTSLSFASIGIAVTQLFRLNTSLEPHDRRNANELQMHASDGNAGSSVTPLQVTAAPPGIKPETLRQIGKPLGATFIGISIIILLIGFHRYFESQHYVIRGKFPASRGSIILVTIMAAGLIIASLVIVVTVARGAIET
ncbi:hypothetical protein K431DRAFT_280528 [Polychaeton citri CBS 116435]|uniref:DUF202 domain-containing protein n=1 Tax=Polychaeton citri CBS 116435 TaxID=1314669 RepID=A0A9P4QJ11_9PEZI|nr:hypothetical protein K431DRAFT_280528 [Polychaeton citri CBS 116435]